MTQLLSLCVRSCLPALMLLLAAGAAHADRIKDLASMAATARAGWGTSGLLKLWPF